LRLRATGSYPEYSLSVLPSRYVCANLIDLTGKLEAGNFLRVTGGRRVTSHTLQDVSAIQPGSAYTHANLFRRRSATVGDVANFEYFRTTRVCNYNSFHFD
jgi:hypothetical protein